MAAIMARILAAGPSVDVGPNKDGLPGVSEATKIVGALLTFGLIAAVAGIVLAATTWAIGSNSSNPHLAGRGKTGVIVSCLAALVVGGADILVNFFAGAGAGL
ncbi:MAG: DUF6112 family protein [Jatrophihabitantaceae bacterium]